jgi:hypothetical protein
MPRLSQQEEVRDTFKGILISANNRLSLCGVDQSSFSYDVPDDGIATIDGYLHVNSRLVQHASWISDVLDKAGPCSCGCREGHHTFGVCNVAWGSLSHRRELEVDKLRRQTTYHPTDWEVPMDVRCVVEVVRPAEDKYRQSYDRKEMYDSWPVKTSLIYTGLAYSETHSEQSELLSLTGGWSR